MVLGIVAYIRLGVDLLPNVELPIVVVTSTLQGADVEAHIDGQGEPMTSEVAVRDDACALGQWIHGEGRFYLDDPAYKELKAAQKEPEKHQDLIVRVSGFSARFVDIPTYGQNTIIARNEQSFGANDLEFMDTKI